MKVAIIGSRKYENKRRIQEFVHKLKHRWKDNLDGSFFNNWLMIVYSFPVGFYLQSIYLQKFYFVF